MDGLSVLWFAGAYGLAWVSDLGPIRPPGRRAAALAIALTAMGWMVHTAYLGRPGPGATGPLPLTTAFGSLLVLAWILAAIDLCLIACRPRPVAVGVFVLPVVLVLMLIAGLLYPRERPARRGRVAGLRRGGARPPPAARGDGEQLRWRASPG